MGKQTEHPRQPPKDDPKGEEKRIEDAPKESNPEGEEKRIEKIEPDPARSPDPAHEADIDNPRGGTRDSGEIPPDPEGRRKDHPDEPSKSR